jgi:PAS domain S-box-containing protein
MLGDPAPPGEDVARLRESLARFQILVEEAEDVAIVLDGGGRAHFMSAALRRVLGWAPDHWVGRRLWGAVHRQDQARARAALGWLRARPERTGELELRCAHADGGWRRVRVVGRNLLADPTLPGLIIHFQDVTSWREAEAALHQISEDLGREAKERARKALEKERLLEDLAATLPGAVYGYREDAAGRKCLDYVSAGVQTLTGLPASAILEDPGRVLDRVPAEDRARLAVLTAQSLTGLDAFVAELRVRQADGSERWVSVHQCPRRLPDGGTVWSGVALDIGARRRAEESLLAAHAEVARAARLKDEFQAHISHELRTPLTNVLAQAQALAEGLYGPLNAAQIEAVAGIKEGGERLAALVRDLLDVARLHAGELRLDPSPCRLRDVASAAVGAAQRGARDKGIAVDIAIAPPDLVVVADGPRLQQVLGNLLGNAVKFTPPGGRVGVRAAVAPDADRVRIEVWDTGIGIAAGDLARVFEPFVQLNGGRTRRHSGVGLGLVLARRVVELHGGQIEVASQPGAGSVFTVVLPWHPVTTGLGLFSPVAAVAPQQTTGSLPDADSVPP